MRKCIFLLLLSTATALVCSCTQGRDRGIQYYFDAENGSNSNNGLSEKKPWKTLSMIQTIELKPGDKLLLNRGSVFHEKLDFSAKGAPDNRIVIDAYGSGKKPCIVAPDSSLFAIRIVNSDYLTVQNVEVVNNGSERMDHRVGVELVCENHGVSHNLVLRALEIRDVNGGLLKNKGEGAGILMRIKGNDVVSRFDSLLIEDCIIRRCERNAIIWKVPANRERNWAPSTNVVFRKNLIEEVPGDGIVPIACEGALIEYNLMRNGAALPEMQAAAGMWPWSCDNTMIRFNEVSDHKAPWDGQGFDSDFNCTNTTIQYNYSHNNDGGFILICDAGEAKSNTVGNVGTVVRYNVSIGDAVRSRETHAGIFSPTIHIAGPCKNTRIYHNIFHINKKPNNKVDRKAIVSDSWGGYADHTAVEENVFYTAETSAFKMTQSTNNLFNGNYYLGAFNGKPADKDGKTRSAFYDRLLEKDPTGFESLAHLFEKVEIADGAAYVTVVSPEAIDDFFAKMKQD